MDRTEEQEFKEMVKQLRTKTKISQFEYELREENLLLEKEISELKNDNALLNAEVRDRIKEIVELKFNVENFIKREAISFMRLFKGTSNNETLTDEVQTYINHFIYKLTHCLFLSKRR